MSQELEVTNKIQLILIGGTAESGKTTASNYIFQKMNENHDEYIDVVQMAFASPIKMIAERIFGWDGKKDAKGRKLLQVIGTDAGREYNQDIWVNRLEEDIYSIDFPPNFVLVDDWRFPNERDKFLNSHMFDVTTIRIERPGHLALGENGNHLSENSIPKSDVENLTGEDGGYYTLTVVNDGTLEEFHNKLSKVVSYLETKIVSVKGE